MDSPILITGGTGTLGRRLVLLLLHGGRSLRVLSRSTHASIGQVEYIQGDLLKGGGIDAAVSGVATIIHCAGAAKGDEIATANLMRAAKGAGVRHVVYISVIGADRIPQANRIDQILFGYFGAKLESERIIAASGLPWTVLRAAQFHDLLVKVMQQMARLPVIPVPAGVRFQPIDAGEVAARLAELALSAPAGLVPDMAGPEIVGMAEMMRTYLRAAGKRRIMVPVWLPGEAARALRSGANLAPGRAIGQMTWVQALMEHRT